MNKKILFAFLLGFATAAPLHAAEEGDVVMGGGLNLFTYSEAGFPDASPMGVDFHYRKYFKPKMAVEGRIGLGMATDEVDVFGIGVELSVENYYGVYARFDFGDRNFVPYGILGYSRVATEANAQGFTASSTGTGLSYGIGADWMFNDKMGLNFEYMMLHASDEVDISSINLGLVVGF